MQQNHGKAAHKQGSPRDEDESRERDHGNPQGPDHPKEDLIVAEIHSPSEPPHPGQFEHDQP
jgi:hypothetical protein